jgi:hypothetical protein
VAAVEAEPAALDGMLDAFIDDPRFGDRVRSLFADALRTRKDHYRFAFSAYDLPAADNPRFQAAVAEEALNLIALVAVRDSPFTDVLTERVTVVDPILLDVWPLAPEAVQPPDLPPRTVLARYTDGRPRAGILATNGFFWRHESTVENANRGRTNAISRALLCEDYLDRPIDFPADIDLTNPEAIADAIRTNQGCSACHATMDPFAAHLGGFLYPADDARVWARYQPESELGWKTTTQAAPSYFGEPTKGRLDELARAIAADDRFASCTVRRVYERLLGRASTIADDGQLAVHREAFLGSGLSLKALFRSVVRDPAYRGSVETSPYGGAPEPALIKLASPELLASALSDLSGYELVIDGRPATSTDLALRALAGGSDRGATPTPSLGHALVQRRLAEASARALVDGLAPDSRVGALLAAHDATARPSADLIAALSAEIVARRADPTGEEVGALLAIWDAVAISTNDSREAMSAVLVALFADPEMALY